MRTDAADAEVCVTPEMVAIEVFVAAYLDGQSQKERARFLQEANRLFERLADLSSVPRLRSRRSDHELSSARRLAVAWWQRVLGSFVR